MFRTTQKGKFNPDESPSQRAEAIANGYETGRAEGLGDGEASRAATDRRLEAMEPCEDEESESAESCAEVPDCSRKPPSAARLPFDASDDRELKIHRFSGIVHRVREGDTLVCGRLVTERYRAYSADDEEDPEVCQQSACVLRL